MHLLWIFQILSKDYVMTATTELKKDKPAFYKGVAITLESYDIKKKRAKVALADVAPSILVQRSILEDKIDKYVLQKIEPYLQRRDNETEEEFNMRTMGHSELLNKYLNMFVSQLEFEENLKKYTATNNPQFWLSAIAELHTASCLIDDQINLNQNQGEK